MNSSIPGWSRPGEESPEPAQRYDAVTSWRCTHEHLGEIFGRGAVIEVARNVSAQNSIPYGQAVQTKVERNRERQSEFARRARNVLISELEAIWRHS